MCILSDSMIFSKIYKVVQPSEQFITTKRSTCLRVINAFATPFPGATITEDLPFLDISYKTEPYNMWSFVSDFFHLAYFWAFSMLWLVSVLCFFSLLSSSPFYGYIILYSPADGSLGCFCYLVVMNNLLIFTYKY